MSLKSQRDITQNFDQNQFNLQFENKNKELEKAIKQEQTPDMLINDESINKKLPHERSIEDILIIIRELFYKILEMLLDGINPIPFILSSQDRFYGTSIFLIIIGSCLLLLSNLMI